MAIADYVPPITQLQQELEMWRCKAHYNEEKLRDRFAMAVMTGLQAAPDQREYNGYNSHGDPVSGKEWRDELIADDAEYCYRVADAMLKAREKE